MTQSDRPCHIRPLRAADREGWAALWSSYVSVPTCAAQLDCATVAEAAPREPVSTEATFCGLIGTGPGEARAMIALRPGHDGVPVAVGFVHYVFLPRCWRRDPSCYLQDLFVRPQDRGLGLGRALVMSVYDAADAAGAPRVWWLSGAINSRARALYDRVAQRSGSIGYERRPAT